MPSSGGVARTTLTSSTSAGPVTVNARAGGASQNINLTFEPGSAYSLWLSETPSRLIVGQSVDLEANVFDFSQNPVANGTLVRFETTVGTLGNQEPVTSNGIASTTLSSTVPGTATITATSGHAADSVNILFVYPMSLDRIGPNDICVESWQRDFRIVGSGFPRGVTATLSDGDLVIDMGVIWVSTSALTGTATMSETGSFDLTVIAPYGDAVTLTNALTVTACQYP